MSSSSSYARREQSERYPAQLTASIIQAALFASFLSTFLIQTLSLLQPDPLDAIQDILLYQTLVMQNSTSGPYVSPVFSPPPYAVTVNALFFASLGVVLLAAFLCMLVKGWIRELDSNLRNITDTRKRAVIRELRDQGLVRWRFPEVIAILPSLIHLSLLLFFIGLALYLLQIHKLPAFLTISIFGLGMLLYVLSIFISAIDVFSPFHSPYSRALGVLYHRLYSRLLSPFVYDHLSLMALPQTIIEKIREQMSTFIKAHEPLSELRILYPYSPSSKQLLSQTSASILDQFWIYSLDTSAYAKNVCASVLLQLDDLNILPPRAWHLYWPYDTGSPSMKEAQCLVYAACMQGGIPVLLRLKTIRASIELLEQDPDPWFRLVTLLIRLKIDGDDWNILKSDIESEGWYLSWKAELLQAISGIQEWSEGQWLFILCAILTLITGDNRSTTCSIRVLAPILVKLLQSRVNSYPRVRGEELDFWLRVMMTLINGKSTSILGEWITHAEDIDGYGGGNFRDPDYIRRLFQLSQDRELDPSLMRECLVTILYILISGRPRTQQGIRLVNQYLDIIREKTDVITWSIPLMELPSESYHLEEVVLCLLSGMFPVPEYGWGPFDILHGFDRELSTAGAQPTTSILKVINSCYCGIQWLTVAKLQNAWLSLCYHNLTCSSFKSTIPLAWSPDCTSIASTRLDLYDSNTVVPEMDLVIFFLSSHSVSIACRALRWYLRLKENTPIHDDTLYFVPFSNIFRKGLSMDENRESWLLLVELITRNWDGAPSEWRSHFVETFFGYKSTQADNQSSMHKPAQSMGVEDEKGHPDIRTQASTAQSDGLGWMEDVWMTVSRPCITPIKLHWLKRLGVMHAAYPEPTRPDDETDDGTSPPESSAHAAPDGGSDAVPDGEASQAALPKSVEKRLEDSARELLEVLATLLEAGTTSMPKTLRVRLRSSCLLKDERLSHDADSLHRIEAVLNRNQEG